MADPPTGDGYVWSARLASSYINLDPFVSNGSCTIPVALQYLDDSKICFHNARGIQENLRNITTVFKDISEVKYFGKNRIICRSRNLGCVANLLKC